MPDHNSPDPIQQCPHSKTLPHPTWVTKDERAIPTCLMEDDHLRNAWMYFTRQMITIEAEMAHFSEPEDINGWRILDRSKQVVGARLHMLNIERIRRNAIRPGSF